MTVHVDQRKEEYEMSWVIHPGSHHYSYFNNFTIVPAKKKRYAGDEREIGKFVKNGISCFSGKWLGRKGQTSYRYLLSESGVPIAGMQVVDYGGKKKACTILNIFTAKNYRRKGFMKKLYFHVKEIFDNVKFGNYRSKLGNKFCQSMENL